MDCRTAQMLMPFARPAGELPADEADRVKRHLAECPACRDAVRGEQQFDAAVGRAMTALDVPVGLREQIGTRLAEQRGRRVQRRIVQALAAAAALILVLSYPLGWWSSPTPISPEQLVELEDQHFVSTFNGSRDMAESYFRGQGVKTELPRDLDYALLASTEVVSLMGKNVARLDFQKGPNRAKVYVLPRRDFRLAKNASTQAGGSHCTIEVDDTSARDFVYVIVYFGQAERRLFQPEGVVG